MNILGNSIYLPRSLSSSVSFAFSLSLSASLSPPLSLSLSIHYFSSFGVGLLITPAGSGQMNGNPGSKSSPQNTPAGPHGPPGPRSLALPLCLSLSLSLLTAIPGLDRGVCDQAGLKWTYGTSQELGLPYRILLNDPSKCLGRKLLPPLWKSVNDALPLHTSHPPKHPQNTPRRQDQKSCIRYTQFTQASGPWSLAREAGEREQELTCYRGVGDTYSYAPRITTETQLTQATTHTTHRETTETQIQKLPNTDTTETQTQKP